MTRLNRLSRASPVHQRKIEIRFRPGTAKQQIIVEGWLTDNRRMDGYHWDGRPRPPGVVHRIGVRLFVGEWPLTIQEAEAEMVNIPHELCPTVADSSNKIVGLACPPGSATRSGVAWANGGLFPFNPPDPGHGPGHLPWLLNPAFPTAPTPPPSIEEFQGLSYLINSCQLWSENGPLLRMVRDTIEREQKLPRNNHIKPTKIPGPSFINL